MGSLLLSVLLAKSSGGGWGCLILLAVLAIFALFVLVYNKGIKEGERHSERKMTHEQDIRQRTLDSKAESLGRRERQIEDNEDTAACHLNEARRNLEYSRTVREQAESDLAKAYANGIKKKEDELRAILHSVVSANPDNRHIARVVSDAEAVLIDKKIIDLLEWSAPKTAAKMQKRFNESCRQDRFEARFYKYQTDLYEYLVPKLKEYAASIEDEKSDAIRTEESDWLTDEEYSRLSAEERSQLALDRYVKSKKKSKWQIGRDYELYVGYLYRNDGWDVEQKGIRDGLNDLGRDLICKKGNRVHIVQCKYWSQDKVIHEKHIAQLYGTTIAYKIEHDMLISKGQPSLFSDFFDKQDVQPVFWTSTDLSDQAKLFAKTLGVTLKLNQELGEFPRIKCNVGRSGEKIFHLPFDQQYDTTIVTPEQGDCYAMTVREAMDKGFRRAMRHFISG